MSDDRLGGIIHDKPWACVVSNWFTFMIKKIGIDIVQIWGTLILLHWIYYADGQRISFANNYLPGQAS